jgi:hypothetical protein
VYVSLKAWPAALAVWRRIRALEVRSASRPAQSRRLIAALEVLAGDTDPLFSGRDQSFTRRALYELAPR